MPERLTAAQRAALRRLADGKTDGIGMSAGFTLFFSGLSEIDEKGVMRITDKGRRALEEDGAG